VQVRIDTIIVRKRVRHDLGDLTSLKESLRQHGLLNPIVITSDNVLVAGHRRLEAAKQLGWSTIAVRIVDHTDDCDQLEMEIEENTQRKNLSTDELAEAYLRLDKLQNPGLLRRIWLAIVDFFRRIFRRGSV